LKVTFKFGSNKDPQEHNKTEYTVIEVDIRLRDQSVPKEVFISMVDSEVFRIAYLLGLYYMVTESILMVENVDESNRTWNQYYQQYQHEYYLYTALLTILFSTSLRVFIITVVLIVEINRYRSIFLFVVHLVRLEIILQFSILISIAIYIILP